MALLKKPNELPNEYKLAGLMYGQPGVGKTTLLLSAPNPVLIDADMGMKRVSKRFQVPSLPMKKYSDFLELIEGDELNDFDSICISTLGRFIERMGDHLMDLNPKLRQGDGSLAMKGYTAIKTEFQRVMRRVKDKNKHLFFDAHEKEEKENDGRYMRPDSPGSAGKDLVKDLDFLGYMEMNGNKHTISFSPTEKYYAKNSLKLDAVIDVPDPDKVGNTFLQKHIIERAATIHAEDEAENKRYEQIMADHINMIAAADCPEKLDAALKTLLAAPVLWDSQRQAKRMLNERAKSINCDYDKTDKVFKVKAAPVAKDEPEVSTAKGEPPAQPKKEKVPNKKIDTLAEAIINGVNECQTEAQMNAYLKVQDDDIKEIRAKGSIDINLRLDDAIKAKQPKAA